MNYCRIRMTTPAALFVALCLIPTHAFGQTVVDDINGDQLPDFLDWSFASDVGWFYTPAFSYELTGIQTKFRTGDSRNVTVQFFATSALNTPDVSSPLASALFQPVANTFTGGTFSSSVALTAGTQYFVGFRNVNGLRVNTTAAVGATNLGILRGSDDGTYSTIITGNGFAPSNYQPIIRFLGPSAAAPEPSGLALIAGLGTIGGLATFRRRTKGRT